MNNLDQFYTNPKIIPSLIKKVDEIIKKSTFPLDVNWIEPSAGCGNFIDVLEEHYTEVSVLGYDIYPFNNSKIIKADFLKIKPLYKKNNIIIGNPPFGKRAKQAINFVNKSFEWADIVAFILPNQFKRYLTQNQIIKKAKLLSEIKVPKNSFLMGNRSYNVNCVFQIWVNSKNVIFSDFKNYRKNKPLPRTHKDLKTFIHNNTSATLKYFDKNLWEWDFAVPRQGYYNYNNIIKNSSELIENKQYFFIKCLNPNSKKIIEKIDFNLLAKSNTVIPGFSTTDFIKEYKKMKNKSTLNLNHH